MGMLRSHIEYTSNYCLGLFLCGLQDEISQRAPGTIRSAIKLASQQVVITSGGRGKSQFPTRSSNLLGSNMDQMKIG